MQQLFETALIVIIGVLTGWWIFDAARKPLGKRTILLGFGLGIFAWMVGALLHLHHLQLALLISLLAGAMAFIMNALLGPRRQT